MADSSTISRSSVKTKKAEAQDASNRIAHSAQRGGGEVQGAPSCAPSYPFLVREVCNDGMAVVSSKNRTRVEMRGTESVCLQRLLAGRIM